MARSTAKLQGRGTLDAVRQLVDGGNTTEIGTTEAKGLGRDTKMRVVRTLESKVPLELLTTSHVRPRDARTLVLVQVKEANELATVLETREEGRAERHVTDGGIQRLSFLEVGCIISAPFTIESENAHPSPKTKPKIERTTMRLQPALALLFRCTIMLLLLCGTRAWGWLHKNTYTASFCQDRPLLATRNSSPLARRHATSSSNKHFISVDDAIEKQESIRFVDGSWYHKGDKSGRHQFERTRRIVDADYFDIDDIATSHDLFPSDNPKQLSHMLPPPTLFASYMDAIGLLNTDHLVIYGQSDCYFLPRVWFTFTLMGHKQVQLLDGSLDDWEAAGGAVELCPKQVIRARDLTWKEPTRYATHFRDDMVVDLDTLRHRLDGCTLLDPRGSSFQYGHMPKAIHVPYTSLHVPGTPTRLRPLHELKQLVPATTGDDNIVVSCGSGVSACTLYLVLDLLGRSGSAQVYDGSWQEWNLHDDLPKVLPESS